MPCNSCGNVNTSLYSPCSNCGCQPSCAPLVSPCDPCGVPVSTPMTNCERPTLCNEGCVETISCHCVIYKGIPLPTLNLRDGQTLCDALVKLDSLLNALLIEQGSSIPNYNYVLPCLSGDSVPLTLLTCVKNGASQIVSSTNYPNAPALLTFLQSLDPAWTYTAPNLFSIVTSDVWSVTMGCPS